MTYEMHSRLQPMVVPLLPFSPFFNVMSPVLLRRYDGAPAEEQILRSKARSVAGEI